MGEKTLASSAPTSVQDGHSKELEGMPAVSELESLQQVHELQDDNARSLRG